MANLGSIFLGGVPPMQRRYLRALLEFYYQSGFDRVHVPCVGQFTIVKCALEAGFAPENIFTSDVSLFSTVLGYLYSGQPLSEIVFEIVDPELKVWYDSKETDAEKACCLFIYMKLAQFHTQTKYEKMHYDEVYNRKEHYHAVLLEQVLDDMKVYGGIQYQVMDVRDMVKPEFPYTASDIGILNPPAYAKGYEKMFSFGKYIKYPMPTTEFDFGKEWVDLYYRTKDIDVPFIYYTSKKVKGIVPDEDIVFAVETGTDKYSYFLNTRPYMLEAFEGLYKMAFKNTGEKSVPKFELLSRTHELTPEDKITILPITKETALYYRDLFAHRLGATQAEIYFGVFVNGKLMSTSGFNTSFLRRLQETYIFENFCFSIAHDRYENLNRLSMMCLVSGQFRQMLEHVELKNSAYVDLRTFRTVCLTKYRKSKLNNGLLTLLSSERMENGTYKLIYEQPFYKGRTYADCLRIYLDEDVRIKKSWQAKNGLELGTLK